MGIIEGGSDKRVIEGVEQFGNGNLVNSGTMFEGLQVGNLAFVTIEIKLLEYRQGFGMLPDDIGDNHVFADHGEHLVVSGNTAAMGNWSGQSVFGAQGGFNLGRHKPVNVAVQ
jgi:hypothetical protein